MHPRVLASEQMTRAVPGFYMRSDAPAGLRTIAEVVQRDIRPGAVISHVTAAEIFAFPLPRSLTHTEGEPVHCRITGEGKSRSGALLAVHVGAGSPSIRHHGLTISHPVIALQEIARLLSHDDLVACVDSVAATRNGSAVPVPLTQIREQAAQLKGRGAAALRRAATDARERVWSPMETKMRLLILAHGYPEPITNTQLIDPVTGIVYHIDLAYPQWKIAVEYDGKGHLLDPEQWEKDLHKNEVLHDQGWKVLRISSADFWDPEDFLRRLDAAIADRARRAPAPPAVIRPGAGGSWVQQAAQGSATQGNANPSR